MAATPIVFCVSWDYVKNLYNRSKVNLRVPEMDPQYTEMICSPSCSFVVQLVWLLFWFPLEHENILLSILGYKSQRRAHRLLAQKQRILGNKIGTENRKMSTPAVEIKLYERNNISELIMQPIWFTRSSFSQICIIFSYLSQKWNKISY